MLTVFKHSATVWKGHRLDSLRIAGVQRNLHRDTCIV